MAEEDYSPARWEGTHQHPHGSEDFTNMNGTTAYARAMRSMDGAPDAHSPLGSTSPPMQHSPPLRSSADTYMDEEGESSMIGSSDMKDTASTVMSDPNSLVDGNFDEAVLRSLCELDCGVLLLLDRIKQGMASCREASAFFKRRALIEDEYGKTMQKTARAAADMYGQSDGKAGTFVNAWKGTLKIHDTMGDNRLRFANRLNEMGEELASLAKEVDKNRKQSKELAARYERALQESEMIVEKNKNRLDSTTEELERILLQKEGESLRDNALQGRSPGGGAAGKRVIGKAVAKGGMLLKGKNPGNLQRQEEDIRARMSVASDAYRKSVLETQSMRQEYFNFQLPRILRALKECADEIDLATQYHLTRYAFLFESIVLSDGSTLVPTTSDGAGAGLKGTIETIDNRTDFRNYMQNYAFARGGNNVRVLRREGPRDEGFLPPIPQVNSYPSSVISPISTSAPPLPPPHTPAAPPPSSANTSDKGRPTFGVDLSDQMIRDNVDIPPILEKCCEAIEKYGLDVQGIYRLSGTTSKVQQLKARLDKDLESVDLNDPEWTSDINNVASVLKMWLRELPEALMTSSLQHGFIEGAKIDNDRLRHIRLHERVNELPDPNYSTLKYLLGHLHRVNENEAANSMTAQNLSIVFGPTLFGQQMPNPSHVMNGNGNGLTDTTTYQNIAIETILKHYTDIFVDDAD